MLAARFERDLRRTVEGWVERQLITAELATTLLADAMAHRPGSGLALSAVLGWIGAVVFGTGVVLFFAANWDAMPKLLKLAVLFGGFWLVQALAWLALRRDYGRTGQALVLLGVLLFGANINLIAQIYHIDSHYPDGILLWTLGGLGMAYVAASQTAALAAAALAALWIGTEALDFAGGIPWRFLPLWAALLPLGARTDWTLMRLATAALVGWWLLLGFFADPITDLRTAQPIAGMPLIAAIACVLGYAAPGRWQPLGRSVAMAAAIVGLGLLLLLAMHDPGGRPYFERITASVSGPSWLHAVAVAAVAVVAAGCARRLGHWLDILAGTAWIASIGVVGIALLHWPDRLHTGAPLIIAVGLTLGTLWLIRVGVRLSDRGLINLAVVAFGAHLLVLYFDRFWTLMQRSLLFMLGGLILLGGGWLLELFRRRMLAAAAGR